MTPGRDASPSKRWKTGGAFNLNEAIWTVDLSGVSGATLSFFHIRFGDNPHPLPELFTGSFNGDGVAISDDGARWHTILSAPSTPFRVPVLASFDLAAEVEAAGMSLGADFQIKFQQYDGHPLRVDGRGYDEIQITTSSLQDDWYRLTLEDGRSVTLALDGSAALALYDSDMNKLTTGVAAANVDQLISNFVDPTTDGSADTYYVRVTGADADYHLVATRDAGFDTEPNDGIAPDAQDTSGGYSLRLALGAAWEQERLGTASNDQLSAAQDLSGSFTDLGFGTSDRGAVLGTIARQYGQAANLGPGVNTADQDLNPALSSDGLTLYFNSSRPGGLGGQDLYRATRTTTDDLFGNVTNLGAGVNTSSVETASSLSSDGLSLYFTSDRPGSQKTDIYVATRPTTADPFGNVVRVEFPISSVHDDGSPAISADGRELFFTSNRSGEGGNDIFVASRLDTAFPFPQVDNLGPDINSSAGDSRPEISRDGEVLLFSSSRVGRFGQDDIYELDMNTGATLRVLSSPSTVRGMAFLEGKIYTLELAQRPVILVFDYETGEFERFINRSDRLTYQSLAASGDKLLGPSGQFVFEIDPHSGASNFIGSLPERSAVEGLGVIGDELFVADRMAADSPIDVYDRRTLAYKRTLSTGFDLQAIGADGGGQASPEFYSALTRAGDSLAIDTSIPAAGSGEFVNQLDLAVELYDPEGILVASDPDGSLTHTATQDGIHVIRVLEEHGSVGEYVLSVTGHTGGPAPFAVDASDPPDGATLLMAPTEIRMDFNDFFRLDTIEASDLTIGGYSAGPSPPTVCTRCASALAMTGHTVSWPPSRWCLMRNRMTLLQSHSEV